MSKTSRLPSSAERFFFRRRNFSEGKPLGTPHLRWGDFFPQRGEKLLFSPPFGGRKLKELQLKEEKQIFSVGKSCETSYGRPKQAQFNNKNEKDSI
jgi:hypothetical protein